MATLASLQGHGGGRIPTAAGISYQVSRQELARIIEAMPTEQCRAMHLAVRHGDTTTAQRLLREASESYFALAGVPAAPSASVDTTPNARRATRRPCSR
jgi:hypothetical protein